MRVIHTNGEIDGQETLLPFTEAWTSLVDFGKQEAERMWLEQKHDKAGQRDTRWTNSSTHDKRKSSLARKNKGKEKRYT